MRILVFLLVVLPFSALAQQQTPLLHQDNADHFVKYFLSETIFQQHVTLDSKQSHSSNKSTYFQYNFRHPKFSGKTFVIAFTLDSTGRFVPGKETRGIMKIDSLNDTSWTKAREALRLCNAQGKVKKRSLRLAWDSTAVSYDEYLKTRNVVDIFPGTLVWQIDGQVNFRGDWYSGTFEVDVLTGRVFRRFAIPWD
jgi:hypothetical protein